MDEDEFDLRGLVWERDGGKCVMTGVRVARAAGPWAWVAHHPVPQQHLRREGHPEACADPRFAVTLTRRAHERHHSRTEPVPLEKLPAEVVEAICGLGGWAEARLLRAHPPGRAGGAGTTER